MRTFVIGLALATTALPPEMAGAAERICVIARLIGAQVTVIDAGAEALAAEGQVVRPDMIMRTGSESRAEIRCGDGITVTVGAGTLLDLAELAGEAEQGILMRLFNGIVGIDAPNKTWDRFEVETNLAIASVRSTAWLVESSPETGTAVFVRRGQVAVTSGSTGAELDAGEGVEIVSIGVGVRSLGEGGGAELAEAEVKPVKRWGEARVRDTVGALGFGWDEN
ncbi:MAG: FecR domain-containing protein [Paracoccaceae bacterium]